MADEVFPAVKETMPASDQAARVHAALLAALHSQSLAGTLTYTHLTAAAAAAAVKIAAAAAGIAAEMIGSILHASDLADL